MPITATPAPAPLPAPAANASGPASREAANGAAEAAPALARLGNAASPASVSGVSGSNAPSPPAVCRAPRHSRRGESASLHSESPPSATITCPVIQRAASDARNSTTSARSSAVARRPSGVAAMLERLVFSGSGNCAATSPSISVDDAPFTRMPRLAYSTAR
ncbi:hypothetical protein Y023_5804 [Burkholderia pseudomallei A79D]|nr:hypothetical protein Y024_5755 [Burkholderia pseudomallei TSV44]KGX94480.1 hypothetical protein Y023_5804 [Burkholderia pseudomallei A79D]KGX94937.1 hypothetical protein X997_5633 [Burkholderia pseudomallei A79C]